MHGVYPTGRDYGDDENAEPNGAESDLPVSHREEERQEENGGKIYCTTRNLNWSNENSA
jgi:hypothetical protein